MKVKTKTAWVAGALCALIGVSANAAIVSFGTNFEFSGGASPTGPTPWTTATFNDNGGTGSVVMTLANGNLVNQEFTRNWHFNLDPSLDPTQLVFSAPTKVGTFSDPSISKGVNAFQADGDGRYDLMLEFATSNPNRFGPGESIQYTITGIATLTANSFNFLSSPAGGHGPFLCASHIQGIGASGNDSGWVTHIPEPATVSLAGLALLVVVSRRRIA
jgi:hypothetical protein